MIETARKEDLFLDKKLIIPENKLDAIRIMARLHPVVGDQPTHEKDQPNTNNPILDLACTIANIHEMGIGVHADLRKIQNEPPEYYFGKGFMSGISSLKGNGILAVFGQWRDASGKYAIKQFYYTDKEISYRNALDAKTWSGWIDVLTSNSSLDYNKLLNVPITSTLSDDKTKIASIFAVNNVNRAAVNAQKTANRAQSDAVDAMNEAKSVTNNAIGSGNYLREGSGGWCTMASQKVPQGHDLNNRLESGVYALYAGLSNRPAWQASGDSMLTFGWGSTYYIDLVFGTGGKIAISGTRNGRKSEWFDLYTQENTRVGNYGQLHYGAGKPTDLLAVGDAGLGSFIKILSGNDIPLGELTDGKSGLYANNSYGSGYERSYGIYLKHFGEHESWLSWSYNAAKMYLEATTPQGKYKVEVLHTGSTTTDIHGFLRLSGNKTSLITDDITHLLSDSKFLIPSVYLLNTVNRDVVTAQKSANNANEKANIADQKATQAQKDATKGINDASTADKKAQTAQVTANTGVANAKTAQARADAAFSRIKPITEGGTGATTAANARKNLGLGDASTRNVAAGLGSNGNTLVPAGLCFGFGQRYRDVTADRAFGVPYKNNTKKPIYIMGAGRSNDIAAPITVDGLVVGRIGNGTSSYSFIVFPGSEYMFPKTGFANFSCIEVS